MDFLTALIQFLSGENQPNPLFDIIGKLTSGKINFAEILSSDALQNVLPVFKDLFSNSNQKKNPTESVGNFSRLTPIESFADRQIVYALNNYLGD